MYGPHHEVVLFHRTASSSVNAEGRFTYTSASVMFDVPVDEVARPTQFMAGEDTEVGDVAMRLPKDALVAVGDTCTVAALPGREYVAGRYRVAELRYGRRFVRVAMHRSDL